MAVLLLDMTATRKVLIQEAALHLSTPIPSSTTWNSLGDAATNTISPREASLTPNPLMKGPTSLVWLSRDLPAP